jgi:hypothetical protein
VILPHDGLLPQDEFFAARFYREILILAKIRWNCCIKIELELELELEGIPRCLDVLLFCEYTRTRTNTTPYDTKANAPG